MIKFYGVARLSKEPELRIANNGKHVCKFSVASNREFKNKETGQYDADFFNCTAFGAQADFIESYVRKGNQVFLEGNIQTGSYENREGRRVYTFDLLVERIKLLEKKESASEPTKTAVEQEYENDYSYINQDDLPF